MIRACRLLPTPTIRHCEHANACSERGGEGGRRETWLRRERWMRRGRWSKVATKERGVGNMSEVDSGWSAWLKLGLWVRVNGGFGSGSRGLDSDAMPGQSQVRKG